MRFGIYTLDDCPVAGKTVLCRVDINQPIDRETGTLKSTARIEACLPTLRELAEKGARVVVLAHQGSDIEYQNFYTTAPHAKVLSELLGFRVDFIDDVCGPAARQRIAGLADGDVLLLDNVRFCAEEQTLFERALKLPHARQAETQVVQKLAPLASLYVCDAFAAAHRDQPSLCGFQQKLPSVMGRLFEKEYCVLSELMEQPRRPCVFVLGGAKIADAFLMMESVLEKGAADTVLTGGLVASILLAAAGRPIGAGSLAFIRASGYEGHIQSVKGLLQRHGAKIRLPEQVAYLQDGQRREASPDALPQDANILDIGGEAAAAWASEILRAQTVFVNGPMGVFEQPETELGTRTVWDALGITKATTVVGGGDSIAATAKYGKTGAISYICTGGGALIRFLAGEELPVVAALRHAAKAFPV